MPRNTFHLWKLCERGKRDRVWKRKGIVKCKRQLVQTFLSARLGCDDPKTVELKCIQPSTVWELSGSEICMCLFAMFVCIKTEHVAWLSSSTDNANTNCTHDTHYMQCENTRTILIYFNLLTLHRSQISRFYLVGDITILPCRFYNFHYYYSRSRL